MTTNTNNVSQTIYALNSDFWKEAILCSEKLKEQQGKEINADRWTELKLYKKDEKTGLLIYINESLEPPYYDIEVTEYFYARHLGDNYYKLVKRRSHYGWVTK